MVLRNWWNTAMEFSYAPQIVFGLAIVGTVIFYQVTTHYIKSFSTRRAFTLQNTQTVLFFWRYGYILTVMVTFGIVFAETIGLLGLSLGFLTTMLGWGFRNPILNSAGWILIITRKPFQIGDRVILGGLIGDVKDISITYTVLEQVGGTIASEDKSGRSIMIPNLYLFEWAVINYTLDENYILDEVPIRLTYDSNIERAEEIMLCHGSEVTFEAIRDTGEYPFVRFELIPSGVIARLRYRVLAVERPRISTLIVKRIFDAFADCDDIRFAHVNSDVTLHPKGIQLAPPQSRH